MRPRRLRRASRRTRWHGPHGVLVVCLNLGVCAAAMHALPAAVAADDTAPDFGKTLTGDWAGLRTRLLDQGVDLTLGYISEVAGNTQGGADKKTRYTDQWSYGTVVDLRRLLGWDHATFELLITNLNGRSLDSDAEFHTLQEVMNIYGRGQTWRLTRLSYKQTWFDDALDLKLGRLPVGDDFASFPCDFQNLTFCGSQPGNVRGELWYSYPVSQWGARVKLALGGDTSVKLAVYQVNPTYIDDSYAHHRGLYPDNPPGTTGALIPIEFQWRPAYNGLPGSYKVGAWYDTSNADDVFFDTSRQPIALTGGTPLKRGSRSGVYFHFAQQITGRANGRGVSTFLNVSQSDRATAASMDRQIAFGLVYKGPFDARPGDVIGFALGSNHVNNRVADGVRRANDFGRQRRPVPGSESVAELFYKWKPLPFFSLQPSLQYVRHPGGVSVRESIVVIGLRTDLDF